MSVGEANMHIVDSHTGGEPTRVIVAGGPDLGEGTLSERLARFRNEFDHYRRLAINEPRGSDALVGALLCRPDEASCAAGVIFFNNAGYLGMCGHGAMGVAVTLAHLSRIGLGVSRLQTPVGVVEANLLNPHEVAIENVPSYRYRERVSLDVEGVGVVCGDIAWGGNWFFLVDRSPLPVRPQYLRELTEAARRIRSELRRRQITGCDDAEIDHVEFFGAPDSGDAHSRNFVLCPGDAYDRSPCGTGTSAKLACLAADGKLQPGELWVQESIIGSRFVAQYRVRSDGSIVPMITGSAYICGEGRLISQAEDPFRHGIPTWGIS